MMEQYVCPKCGEHYSNSEQMVYSSITTNGGCDWPDTDTYYNCKCGELLGSNGTWYCKKLQQTNKN